MALDLRRFLPSLSVVAAHAFARLACATLGFCTLACAAFACLAQAQSPAQPASQPHPAAHGASLFHDDGRYIGPGSCSAVACHGGIEPRSVTDVLQNEYSTWVTRDKHARAYTSLTEPLGEQIAQTLHLGAAEKAQRCLACHALDVPASQQARRFDLADGVSCESCHGPASRWIGPHIQANAQHAQMVALGLYDNRNLVLRTERCLTCHLGAPGLSVDHELIAAGHPDLRFELDSFTAVEPPHWVEKNADGLPLNDPLFGTRAWAIGQAVQLRVSMERLERTATSGAWPEFSEMDCISCHHSLTGPLSWRQRSGYPGHRAGDPPYNLSRYVLFQHLANEVDPATSAQLNQAADRVAQLVTRMSADRSAVVVAATRAAQLSDTLANELQNMTYDRARTERLLLTISADADALSLDGERTAEQATMTLDALYIADANAGAKNPATREAIDGLFKLVNNPSAYNAPQFAAQLRRVHETLR